MKNRPYEQPEDRDAEGCFRRLWAAVIIQAADDLNRRDKRKSVHFWLSPKNFERGIGSFAWVCQALDLDPEWTRRAMRTKKRRKLLPSQKKTTGE